MSPDVRSQVAFEFEQLDLLLRECRPLLRKVESASPDLVETIAVGAVLQSFYNGIENTLKRVCQERYETLPTGREWHAQLLNLATVGLGEQGFISTDLRAALREYQSFRHFFRHAYSYRLDWAKMRPLADRMPQVLDLVRSEILNTD